MSGSHSRTMSRTRGTKDLVSPSALASLAVVLGVAAVLVTGTIIFQAPIELSMLFVLVLLMILLIARGRTYHEVQDAAFDWIRKILELVFILLSVGMLVSTWALSGTIPTIIAFGLETISPTWFFVTSVLLCSMTSLFTGTSWGTMGSVGVALMVVGESMGMPAGITAGAIISGSYFGDKLSLLSDTTNLSAAITRTPLVTHVVYMLLTTVPAYLGTLTIFGVLGFVLPRAEAGTQVLEGIGGGLAGAFELGPVTLIPAVVTIGMLLFRLPPFVSIMGGVVAAIGVAVLVQGATAAQIVTTLYEGFVSETGVPEVDDLVSGGGLLSMAGLAMLFMFAVGVSGLLSLGGYVQALLGVVLKWASSRRRLMVLTSPVMIVSVGLGASFSFAAVIVGSLFGPAFERMGLKSQNLSRTLEDSGTVYDAFYPWSGGGIFAAGVLGVATLEYMPFMFFAFLSTLFGLIVALTQFRVAVIEEPTTQPAPRAATATRQEEAAVVGS